MATSSQQQALLRLDRIAGAFIALILSFFGRQLADDRMSPVDSKRWNEELAEDLYALSMQVVGSEGEIEMKRFMGSGFDTGQVENYLARGALLTAQNINDGTAQIIEDALAKGNLTEEQARTAALHSEAAQKRAATLAEGKASHLQSFSSMEAAKQEGGEYTKTWVWSNLPNSRHELLAGQTVPVHMPFSNGLQYPHDPAGLPSQITNCKCSLRVNGVRNLEVLEGKAGDYVNTNWRTQTRDSRGRYVDKFALGALVEGRSAMDGKPIEGTVEEVTPDYVYVRDSEGDLRVLSEESTKEVNSDVPVEIVIAETEAYSGPQRTKLKLTASEREHMLEIGRRSSNLEAAKDAMYDFLLAMPWFEEMDSLDLSDYAFSAAKFTHAKEYKESWA